MLKVVVAERDKEIKSEVPEGREPTWRRLVFVVKVIRKFCWVLMSVKLSVSSHKDLRQKSAPNWVH